MDYLVSIKVCALPEGSFIFIGFIGFLSSVKDLMLSKDRVCIKDFFREMSFLCFFHQCEFAHVLNRMCGNWKLFYREHFHRVSFVTFSVGINVNAVFKGSFKFTPFLQGFSPVWQLYFFPFAQLHNLSNKAFSFFFFHISCQQFFPTSAFKIYYVPIALSLAGCQ